MQDQTISHAETTGETVYKAAILAIAASRSVCGMDARTIAHLCGFGVPAVSVRWRLLAVSTPPIPAKPPVVDGSVTPCRMVSLDSYAFVSSIVMAQDVPFSTQLGCPGKIAAPRPNTQ